MNNLKYVVGNALERQNFLEIEYKDKNNAKTNRLILPLYWDGNDTIVAFCFLRKADRHFKIDNITSALELGEDAIAHLPLSLRPRKIEFPPNKYFGILFVTENIDRTLLFPYDFEVNTLRGKILLPPGKHLCLSLQKMQKWDDYIHPDITILQDFKKNDLQAIEIGSQAWEIDLKHIRHFSDLKWIRLNYASNKNLEDLYQI